MKNEKSAGAVIFCIDKEPEFLLLKNTLKKTYWEFPKGKIEESESPEAAALRESQEETGLNNLGVIPGFKEVLNWFFMFNKELIKKEAVYFLAEVSHKDKQKVRISKEHEGFKWVNFEEANKVINIKANRELLGKANDFILEKQKQKKLFS